MVMLVERVKGDVRVPISEMLQKWTFSPWVSTSATRSREESQNGPNRSQPCVRAGPCYFNDDECFSQFSHKRVTVAVMRVAQHKSTWFPRFVLSRDSEVNLPEPNLERRLVPCS